MPIIIQETKYENADPGLHDTKIVEVKDLGVVDSAYGKTEKLRIVFEITDQQGEDGKNLRVNLTVTKKLTPDSYLTKYLNQLGVDAKPPFDIEEIVGLTPQIVVVHTKKGDKTYANVESIIPPKRVRKPVKTTDEI